MFFWILVILVLSLLGAKTCKDSYFPDYISLKRIQPIKGIFILLVFLSHFAAYITLNGVWTAPYVEVRRYLGQMVVVPFLFYSGYGIAESIGKKGIAYVRKMPVQRILKVVFQFNLAVLLFLALRYAMGTTYNLKHILLTMVAWKSIGNSNWYIFAIVCLYAITCVAHLLFPKGRILPQITITILTVALALILKPYRDNYCYNTMMAYVAGIWFSKYQDVFEREILAKKQNYWLCLAVVGILFLFGHKYWRSHVVHQTVSVLFAFLMVLVTAKFQIVNGFLGYCGEHLFSLFMLQRLPMLALQNTPVAKNIPVYLLVCLGITLILSVAFDKVAAQLWQVLTVRKKSSQ